MPGEGAWRTVALAVTEGEWVGRSLHESPRKIPCFYDRCNRERFRSNSVIALEIFISTGAGAVCEATDGRIFVTCDGSFVASYEGGASPITHVSPPGTTPPFPMVNT